MRSLRLIGSLAFLGCLPLLLSSKTHALPGLSPVWERLYNNNQPFSETNPSHAPTADPDGDGWTNLRESIAGTNPFSGLPPNGFPQLIISPHLWLENQFELALPVTYPGKDYLLSHSTTLQTGSWTDFPEAFPGTGADLVIPFQPESEGGGAPPDKAFFRASISDQPNPGGTFTPWELAVLSNRQDIALAVLPAPTVTDGADEPPPDPNGDSSGPTDLYDACPQDSEIDFIRTPESRYIHIPVAGVPHPFKAVDVSDSGKILYGGPVGITNVDEQPVGYIWDPLAEPSQRLTAVKFSPGNFRLTCKRITNSTASYPEEPMPLPGREMAGSDAAALGVNLRAIGDDGSVLGDVSYQLRENDGHPEGEVRSADAALVFVWKRNEYTGGHLIGGPRGYSDEGNIISRDHAIGFYTDTNHQTLAVTIKQDPKADRNLNAPLEILTTNAATLAGGYLNGQIIRTGHQDPYGRISRTGKVILTDLVNNQFRYVICGASPTIPLPAGTILDSFSDFPDGLGGPTPNSGKWGLGTRNQAFRIRNGAEFKPAPSAHNVLQWDKYGTGIGPDAAQAIWRNGRMRPFSQVVQGTLAGDIKPRKITTGGLIWVGNDAGTSNGLLIPVEVVAPDLDYNDEVSGTSQEVGPLGMKELKVAKMERSLTGANGLQLDEDRHRFYIRIPTKLPGTVQARLGTDENTPAAYNDNDDTINLLSSENTRMQSQSMILVSDDVDDEADGEDDRIDDRTHRTMPGSKLKITSLKLGGSSYPLDMKVDVPIKEQAAVRVIFVGSANAYNSEFEEFVKVAKERYAQVGIHLSVDYKNMPVPNGINENNVQYESGWGDGGLNLIHDDVKKIVDASTDPSIGRRDFTIYIVADLSGSEAKGKSFAKRRTATVDQFYTNTAVLSAVDIVKDPFSSSFLYTLGHELGHLLTNHFHYGWEYGPDPTDPRVPLNLMRDGTSADPSLLGSKRLAREQEKMILKELK